MANERGTTSIWLAKEKYKSFALACKRFGFQISEILEGFIDSFLERYPLSDPDEMQFVDAPTYHVKSRVHPDMKDELKRGLLKWLNIFKCPHCEKTKHYTNSFMVHLESHGLTPQCQECQIPMEVFA